MKYDFAIKKSNHYGHLSLVTVLVPSFFALNKSKINNLI